MIIDIYKRQLLSHLCFGARFFARVKFNHKGLNCRILGGLKTKLKKCFCLFKKKNAVVRFFSSFAHYELTLNPFCQYCFSKILTEAILVILRKSFSLHVLYC